MYFGGWEKNFQNYPTMDLYPEHTENSYNSAMRRQCFKKWAKYLSRCFTKDIWMGDKHTKGHPACGNANKNPHCDITTQLLEWL